MRNLTRDPFHKLVKTNYCKNFHKLTVSVDGVELDSQYIVNVYRSVSQGTQYVEMFSLDADRKILEIEGTIKRTTDSGKTFYDSSTFLTNKIHGKIQVEGTPQTCGCWRGKQIGRWWDRINQGRGGW